MRKMVVKHKIDLEILKMPLIGLRITAGCLDLRNAACVEWVDEKQKTLVGNL